MFVERLTKEQVEKFINTIYPKKEGYKNRIEEIENSEIRVYVENTRSAIDYGFIVILGDFYTRKISSEGAWLRFLYKVFGEEYKQAYIEECLSVFDED